MAEHACPCWIGHLLVSPLRKLWERPEAVVGPYVAEAMTVLEPGPGMGFFTLELARRVGPDGRVVAVDVQPGMLAGLRRRARKAGLLDRIDTRHAQDGGMPIGDLASRVDFVLAFAMVHEVRDPTRFFREISAAMKPGARMLIAEPRGHVSEAAFDATLSRAAREGLLLENRARVRGSRAAVLAKTSRLADQGGRADGEGRE
jgi:ubiquinone/menaquinone biosynthesis C-methylase UbiE